MLAWTAGPYIRRSSASKPGFFDVIQQEPIQVPVDARIVNRRSYTGDAVVLLISHRTITPYLPGRLQPGAPERGADASIGISRIKTAPLPGPSLWALSEPPMSCAARTLLWSPNPCPPFFVENSWPKIRFSSLPDADAVVSHPDLDAPVPGLLDAHGLLASRRPRALHTRAWRFPTD